MPTYDYVCKACGHRFEEFQSMSADPLKKCPQCNKNQLERLIGIPIYLMLNWLPFLLPLVCFAVGGARGLAILAAVLARRLETTERPADGRLVVHLQVEFVLLKRGESTESALGPNRLRLRLRELVL